MNAIAVADVIGAMLSRLRDLAIADAMHSQIAATPRRPRARCGTASTARRRPRAARARTPRSCARCHGASLGGGDESPPLAGGAFLGNWNGLPLSDLQTRIQHHDAVATASASTIGSS